MMKFLIILSLFIIFILQGYSNPEIFTTQCDFQIERLQRYVYENLWRSPIAFDMKSNFVIYVEPLSNSWHSATKLFKLDLKTNEKTELFPDLKGRFAYPSISPCNKKLAFQFQFGNPHEPSSFDTLFFERKLYIADIENLSAPPQQLTLNKPASLFNCELIPEFSTDSKKIFISLGKVQAIDNRETPKIALVDINTNTSTEFSKGREFIKSTELLPVINKQNGNLFTLLNKASDSSNFSIFRRTNRNENEFNNVSEFWTPKDISFFKGRASAELSVNWLTSAVFSSQIACQVGNWNLFSIVLLDGSEHFNPSAKVLLEGTSEHSFARPSLAPNANWLAYEKLNIEMPDKSFLIAKVMNSEVWLKNLRNNESKKIADDAKIPVFSPDGTKIAYYKKIEGKWEIQINSSGITPEEQGLLSSRIADQLDSLVKKLGADDYQTRESAKIALMKLGKIIEQRLINYEKMTDDPEVKFRLREIIEFINSEAN